MAYVWRGRQQFGIKYVLAVGQTEGHRAGKATEQGVGVATAERNNLPSLLFSGKGGVREERGGGGRWNAWYRCRSKQPKGEISCKVWSKMVPRVQAPEVQPLDDGRRSHNSLDGSCFNSPARSPLLSRLKEAGWGLES